MVGRRAALAGSVLAPLLLASPAWAQEDTGAGGAPPALPGPTDTVLPRTGIDPTLSDLREHLLNAYGDNPAAANQPRAPNLQIQAQIGLSEEYTDNAGAAAGAYRSVGSDFITALTPAIDITDTTQRLQANLDYRPIGELYAKNTGFSQIQQQFSGNILATVLPGWLYLDTRGSVSQQAVYGGFGPSGTVTLGPGDRQTTSAVSISPYISRSFGGAGTLQLGAGYSYSATDAPGLNQAGVPQDYLNTYGNSWLGTTRGFANFTTGEDLGRLRNEIGTDDDFYSGAGALGGGHRILATDDVSYAMTRLVTLLGEAGYEDLDYPRSDYRYVGPVGSGGVQLTPGKGSSLTLEYRYIDGFGAAFVQGSVQVTPHIRVFGGYSEGISTFQQDTQNTLLDGTNGATGVAGSALVASPLLQSSNFFGSNQDLNHLDRLNLSASYLGVRDTVTVTVQRETTTPIGRQLPGYTNVSTSGTFGSISETHQLTPTLSVSAFAQYGSNRTGLVSYGSGQTISVSVGLDKVLGEKLTGFVRFGGTYTVGGSSFAASGYAGLTGNQNTVTVGIVKRF